MIYYHEEFLIKKWSVAHCHGDCFSLKCGCSGRPYLVNFLRDPIIWCQLIEFRCFYICCFILKFITLDVSTVSSPCTSRQCKITRRRIELVMWIWNSFAVLFSGTWWTFAEFYNQQICQDSSFIWSQLNCQTSAQILMDICHQHAALTSHFSCFIF